MRTPTPAIRAIALAATTLVACSAAPAPSSTVESPDPSTSAALRTPNPTAMSLPPTAAPAATAGSTPRPSGAPLAALAPELAEIAWAMQDRTRSLVKMGLLGREATVTRSVSDWLATVRASGRFVLVHAHDADVELIDVVRGETVARLSLPDYSTSFGWLDPSGTYVYIAVQEGWDLGEIRRVRLDGTEDVRFALLDTVRDGVHWTGTFGMADDGTTYVITCPDQGTPGSAATGRCRMAVAPSGAEPGSGSFLLPADLPHPCHIRGAVGGYVMAETMEACDADGGFLPVSFIAIRVPNGTFEVIDDADEIDNEDDVLVIDGEPFLLARRIHGTDDGDRYRIETVKHSLRTGKITRLVPAARHPDPAMLWQLDRTIGGDAVVVGRGGVYLECVASAPDPSSNECPPDGAAIWNPELDRFIPIPTDTFGDRSTLHY